MMLMDHLSAPEKKSVKKPHFFTLFLLMSFASVAAVSYTPALPAITRFFHITEGTAQLTLTLYLLGFALGQLCYGPIANRFGRKPTLYAGLVLAIVSSILCASAGAFHAFGMLVVFRITQALGTAVGMVMSFTIAADYYQQRVARVHALLVLSLGVMSPLSAILGGFLVQHINWESCFYFLAIY